MLFIQVDTNKNYLDLIKTYVTFLGYNPIELFWGIGIRPDSLIEKINKI